MFVCSKCINYLSSLNKFTQPGTSSLFTLIRPPVTIHQTYISSWKRKILRQTERKKIVYDDSVQKRTDRVYVWGSNHTGALGVKSFLQQGTKRKARTLQYHPHRLDFFEYYRIKVKHAAAGYGFTVYLCNTREGMLAYGCGVNTASQLGYQENPPRSGRILDYVIEPAIIDLPLLNPRKTKLVDAACGRAHTWILSDYEGIFSLGDNSFGQCGRSVVKGEEHRGSQTINRITFDKKIKQICCGQDVTVVLTDEGEVYTCGLNTDGQTGLGEVNYVERLTQVEGDIAGENIIQVSVSLDTVLALSDKGEIFGWGSTEYGQFSCITKETTRITEPRYLPYQHVRCVVAVAASGSMCALLNDAGDVYVWGYGLLGAGPTIDQCDTPTILPKPLFGCNQLNPDQKVVHIEAGISHFAALTESGELYMWGRNKTACLGLGGTLDQYFPFKVEVPSTVNHISCGVDHTVVMAKSFA